MSRHYLSERNGPAGPAPMAHKNGGTSEMRNNNNGEDDKKAE